MTLPRLFSLTDYWMKHPPIHLSMSAIVGAFGKSKFKKMPRTRDEQADGNYVDGGAPVPVDKMGNPLTQSPKSLASAVQMLGGKVFRVRRGSRIN